MNTETITRDKLLDIIRRNAKHPDCAMFILEAVEKYASQFTKTDEEIEQMAKEKFPIKMENRKLGDCILDFDVNKEKRDAFIAGYKSALSNKENHVASDNKNEAASVATLSSTVGNSVEQWVSVEHMKGCPEDHSPYAELLRNGYD
jgi:hypothetical protein